MNNKNFGSLNLKELCALYKYAVSVNHENLSDLANYISSIIIDMNPELIKEFF